MRALKVAILCCLLVAVSADADADANRRRGGGRRGSGRFFGGGGFPGVGGHFPGGGFPGGHFPGGGFPGSQFPGGGSSQCRRWCRTPEGQAYCCESAHQPESPVGTKFGRCPVVRPTCPHHTRFGPPRTCSSDFGCAGRDKCCYDRCLQEHVCKPPSHFGHFG
uniref:Crustin 7 n=1 Tax=Penaeus japonicus TaxID=27405 RepID=A0A387J5E9_PENJP|nr:crustin 7 [Penaeus japonicus]